MGKNSLNRISAVRPPLGFASGARRVVVEEELKSPSTIPLPRDFRDGPSVIRFAPRERVVQDLVSALSGSPPATPHLSAEQRLLKRVREQVAAKMTRFSGELGIVGIPFLHRVSPLRQWYLGHSIQFHSFRYIFEFYFQIKRLLMHLGDKEKTINLWIEAAIFDHQGWNKKPESAHDRLLLAARKIFLRRSLKTMQYEIPSSTEQKDLEHWMGGRAVFFSKGLLEQIQNFILSEEGIDRAKVEKWMAEFQKELLEAKGIFFSLSELRPFPFNFNFHLQRLSLEQREIGEKIPADFALVLEAANSGSQARRWLENLRGSDKLYLETLLEIAGSKRSRYYQPFLKYRRAEPHRRMGMLRKTSSSPSSSRLGPLFDGLKLRRNYFARVLHISIPLVFLYQRKPGLTPPSVLSALERARNAKEALLLLLDLIVASAT